MELFTLIWQKAALDKMLLYAHLNYELPSEKNAFKPRVLY